MRLFSRIFYGSVELRISGKDTVRFLNLCSARNLRLYRVRMDREILYVHMLIPDVKQLLEIRRKTHCRIHIQKKAGLPYLCYRCGRRKAFFSGFFLAVILYTLLSSVLWNIHITGNRQIGTETILAVLKPFGVFCGMEKEHVFCADISAHLRSVFPEIIWVSTTLQGSELEIQVRESPGVQKTSDDSTEQEESKKREGSETSEEPVPRGSLEDSKNSSLEPLQNTCCDLRAGTDGVIQSMIVRQGIPVHHQGDFVKKGDIIVEGILPIYDDAGTVVRNAYVHADADILLAYRRFYYQELPRKVRIKSYTGEQRQSFFLQYRGMRIRLPYQKSNDYWIDCLEKQHPIYLTEHGKLPILVGTETQKAYVWEEKRCSDQELLAAGERELSRIYEDLRKKGVQISENNVKINLTDASCRIKGYLGLWEMAIQESPCQIRDEAVGKDDRTYEQ